MSAAAALRADLAAAREFWRALVRPGDVHEVRVPKARGRWRGVVSGYFDNADALCNALRGVSGADAEAVYVTLNPVDPALLARAANRLKEKATETTSDPDIVKRTTLLIDPDAVRPTGISSTDAERDAALAVRDIVRAYLTDQAAWPEPLAATMSGNGGGLLYRIDLPNDDEATALVERVLKALAHLFDSEAVKVDTANSNAARITKIIGTVAAKGDNIPGRPWRLATGAVNPDAPPVPREALARVAALAPNVERPGGNGAGGQRWDLRALLTRAEIGWQEKAKPGYTILQLDRCLTSADHADGAALLEFPSGAVAYKCLHNRCAGKGWADVRPILAPETDAGRTGGRRSGGARATPPGGAPYRIEGGRICRVRYGPNGGEQLDPLCNFAATVTEEIIQDDGQDTTRAFVISGALESGQTLPPARVTAARFAGMAWVPEAWGLHAVVRAGQSTRDCLREAIQTLSPEAPQRRVFTHTGWREIDGVWCYLTAGGAVGREGFEVELGPLACYALPRVAEDPRGAMQASLALLAIGPDTVTFPLWAAVWRAPLAAPFPADLSLWVEGATGSLKSTLAALFLNHYGADFSRTKLPANWEDTPNALEKKAFTLKDALLVVDDYAPNSLNARTLEATAARALRGQGNLAGRARLRSDLTDRGSYAPRGLILSTGEQHPPGQSLLVRTLFVEVDLAALDLAAVTACERERARLPHAMAGYLAWLAPGFPALRAQLRAAFEAARAKATGTGGHLRVPEVLAHLWLGLDCGLAYAVDIGACSAEEAAQLRAHGWAALVARGQAQSAFVEAERPSRLFLTALAALVTQRRAVLADKLRGEAEQTSSGALVGWQDEDALFLIPDAAFVAVARFCREAGDGFPVRQGRLLKDLATEGVSECDPGRHTKMVRIAGRGRRVLALRREAIAALLGEDFPEPVSAVSAVTTFARERE